MKKAVLTALPLLIFAGMFGYQWRLNHPPVSEADVWIQKAAEDVTEMNIYSYGCETRIHLGNYGEMVTTDPHIIKAVLGTLRCEGTLPNPKCPQLSAIDKGDGCSMGSLGFVEIHLHFKKREQVLTLAEDGSTFHLYRVLYSMYHPGSRVGGKICKTLGMAPVRESFVSRFFNMVNQLLIDSQHKKNNVEIVSIGQ